MTEVKFDELGNPLPEGQQEEKKPVDVEQIKKEIEGSLYSRFQGQLQEEKNARQRAERKAEKLEEKLSSVENLPEIESKAEEATKKLFEAEALTVRNRVITSEFPQLKGKENFIPLGTEEQMRETARQMVQQFNLTGTGGESLNSGASPTFTSTLERLQVLSPDQLKEELKKFPQEVVEKLRAELVNRGFGG